MSGPRFVVRWPRQGHPHPQAENPWVDKYQAWLEDTRDGTFVTDGRMEPEDACLGRDLDQFVDMMNELDAEAEALRQELKARDALENLILRAAPGEDALEYIQAMVRRDRASRKG